MIAAAMGAAPMQMPAQRARSPSGTPKARRWLGKNGMKLIMPRAVTKFAIQTTTRVRFSPDFGDCNVDMASKLTARAAEVGIRLGETREPAELEPDTQQSVRYPT